MSLRLVQITAAAAHVDTLRAIAQRDPVLEYRVGPEEDGTRTVVMLVGPHKRQELLDQIQACFGEEKDWRILILPVEAAIPQPEEPEELRHLLAKAALVETREELYAHVSAGATPDRNYFLLVFLSTVVAAVGLIKDNIAVIIGAMVIAPLLGPNLAMILATALGDRKLLARAAMTGSFGIAFTAVLAVALGALLPVDLYSEELRSRTVVGIDSIVLALASGAAAALSVTTGVSSTLVGVMVAVALLPPTVAAGIMLGAQQPFFALGAAILLAVNVVCVNLAGQIVFWVQGIKPRTWLERTGAQQSLHISMAVWAVSLCILSGAIYLRG